MFGILKKKKVEEKQTIDISKEDMFVCWLEKGIKALGASTGYGFNLYEGDDYFWVDFCKAKYDADDEDWFAKNANEFFSSQPAESFFMKATGQEDEWQDALVRFAKILKTAHDKSVAFAKLSKEAKIVFGHHDGDLYTLEEALTNKITKKYVGF